MQEKETTNFQQKLLFCYRLQFVKTVEPKRLTEFSSILFSYVMDTGEQFTALIRKEHQAAFLGFCGVCFALFGTCGVVHHFDDMTGEQPTISVFSTRYHELICSLMLIKEWKNWEKRPNSMQYKWEIRFCFAEHGFGIFPTAFRACFAF